MCYTTVYRGLSSLTLAYPTLDRCITYIYMIPPSLPARAPVSSPCTVHSGAESMPSLRLSAAAEFAFYTKCPKYENFSDEFSIH